MQLDLASGIVIVRQQQHWENYLINPQSCQASNYPIIRNKEMARHYHWNPLKKKPSHTPHPDDPMYGLTYDRSRFHLWVSGNKRLDSQLVLVSELSGVSFPSLKTILNAIGIVANGFMTVAAQAKIAEIARLSKETVQKAISAMARGGVLLTFHRTRQTDRGQRRTTSITILSAFCDFCRWLKNSVRNSLNVLNTSQIKVLPSSAQDFEFDRVTGEVFIQPGVLKS